MQRGAANRSGAVARRATRGATQIGTAPVAKKPAAVVAPRASSNPPAPESDSDDDYSSSCSENSEEYRPLAFGLFKGGPVRKTGAPQQSKYSMRISEDEQDDSGFVLSADEVPLPVTYENGGAKHKYGRGADSAPTATTMYGGVSNSSSDSSCLPIGYTTNRRPRVAGRGVTANGPEVTMEEAEVESVDPEDEMPLNTKLILNLVRRIRMNPTDVPLEAFAHVNWGDENYQEELKPLRYLYEELEAKAREVKQVTSAPQSTKKVDYEARIKEAVMALPQESAIIAKSKRVQAQQLRSQPGNMLRDDGGVSSKNAAISAPAAQLAAGQSKAVVSKARKVEREREKRMEASFGELGRLETSALLARRTASVKPKESTMSEAAKKVRRAGRQANRSATFTDIVVPDGNEEIVEDQQANELPATSLAKSSAAAPITQLAPRGSQVTAQSGKPEKVRRGKRRGANGNGMGRSVSFADLPEDEVGEVKDGATDWKRGGKRRRRATGKRGNNRSCSFTDVIIDTGDELKEEDPARSGEAVPSPAAAATSSTAPNASAKRRTAGNRSGNRTRDFVDVPVESGDEVKGKNTNLRGTGPASSATKKPKQKNPRRSVLGRSRELSISCLDEVVAGEIHENAEDLNFLNKQARDMYAGDTSSVCASRTPRASGTLRRPSMISQQAPVPASHAIADDVAVTDDVVVEPSVTRGARKGRMRKQRKHVSQELSISVIPDDGAGEILERNTERISDAAGATPSTLRSGPATRGSLPRLSGASRYSSVVNSAAVPTAQTARL